MICIQAYEATITTRYQDGTVHVSAPHIVQYAVHDTDRMLSLGVFTLDDDGTAEEIKAAAYACKAKYEAEPWSSPFARHRDILLGFHGSAMRLGRLVLSLYNGHAFPMNVSDLGYLDDDYLEIAIELIRSYHQFGESDREFLHVCDDIKRAWCVGQSAGPKCSNG